MNFWILCSMVCCFVLYEMMMKTMDLYMTDLRFMNVRAT